MINLLDPEIFIDGPPHAIFDELRKNEPVYRQPNPHGGSIWSLTRYEDVREVSKNVALFSSNGLIVYSDNPEALLAQTSHNMMFQDPPVHTRLRNFAAKAFYPAVVARFEGWVRELCIQIADRVMTFEGEFDAVEHISARLPAQVIGSILGVPRDDFETVTKLVMAQVGDFDPEIGPEGALKALATLQAYSLSLRALKLREPGVDMTTQLAGSEGSDSLSDLEYGTMIQTLASAGFETTHTTIAHSLIMSARNPCVREALNTTERSKLALAVDEILRLVTPAMYFARTVTADAEFRGVQMAKGDLVIMWFVAANRDPEKYDRPHEFIADRPARSHLAFGAGGPHFCIGSHLAKLEVELLHQEFSRRGVKLELAGKPVLLDGYFINGVRKLPMRVKVTQ